MNNYKETNLIERAITDIQHTTYSMEETDRKYGVVLSNCYRMLDNIDPNKEINWLERSITDLQHSTYSLEATENKYGLVLIDHYRRLVNTQADELCKMLRRMKLNRNEIDNADNLYYIMYNILKEIGPTILQKAMEYVHNQMLLIYVWMNYSYKNFSIHQLHGQVLKYMEVYQMLRIEYIRKTGKDI